MKRLGILLVILLIGCSSPPSQNKTLSNAISMHLISPAFQNGQPIPSKYTCDGQNISPPLEWSDIPENTVSLVLIVDDPDAIPVAGYVWDHWILYNIPAEVRSLEEGQTAGTEGTTSFSQKGYGGPCPPNGRHTYVFKLYALESELALGSGATKAQVETAMKKHVLAEAQLTGTYDRVK